MSRELAISLCLLSLHSSIAIADAQDAQPTDSSNTSTHTRLPETNKAPLNQGNPKPGKPFGCPHCMVSSNPLINSMDPATYTKWLSASLDPSFYTAAMAPLMNSNMNMKWLMAPIDPRVLQMMMVPQNPNVYMNWAVAPMAPNNINMMMAPLNSSLYSQWANAAANSQTEGTFGSFMNPTAYGNIAK